MRFSIIASFVALSIGLVTSQGAHNSAPTHTTFTLVRRTTANVVTQTNGATTPLTSIVPAVLTPPVGLRDALETVHKVNNEMKGHADELNHGPPTASSVSTTTDSQTTTSTVSSQ